MSRSCSPRSRRDLLVPVRRGAGRYRQDFLGRIIGLDNGSGSPVHVPESARWSRGEHRPDCDPVASALRVPYDRVGSASG
jgi:hypothetical protein